MRLKSTRVRHYNRSSADDTLNKTQSFCDLGEEGIGKYTGNYRQNTMNFLSDVERPGEFEMEESRSCRPTCRPCREKAPSQE